MGHLPGTSVCSWGWVFSFSKERRNRRRKKVGKKGGRETEGREGKRKEVSSMSEGWGLRSEQEAIMENFLEVAAHVESILHREGREGAECDETDTGGSQGCKTRRVCGKAPWSVEKPQWPAGPAGSHSGWVHSLLEGAKGWGAFETWKRACHSHPFPNVSPPARCATFYPSARHRQVCCPETPPPPQRHLSPPPALHPLLLQQPWRQLEPVGEQSGTAGPRECLSSAYLGTVFCFQFESGPPSSLVKPAPRATPPAAPSHYSLPPRR